MQFNRFLPEATPRVCSRQLTLRQIVIAMVSAGAAGFAWYRTGGDYVITALVAVLAAAVIDLRAAHSGEDVGAHLR
jgi:hypothetical protein